MQVFKRVPDLLVKSPVTFLLFLLDTHFVKRKLRRKNNFFAITINKNKKFIIKCCERQNNFFQMRITHSFSQFQQNNIFTKKLFIFVTNIKRYFEAYKNQNIYPAANSLRSGQLPLNISRKKRPENENQIKNMGESNLNQTNY